MFSLVSDVFTINKKNSFSRPPFISPSIELNSFSATYNLILAHIQLICIRSIILVDVCGFVRSFFLNNAVSVALANDNNAMNSSQRLPCYTADCVVDRALFVNNNNNTVVRLLLRLLRCAVVDFSLLSRNTWVLGCIDTRWRRVYKLAVLKESQSFEFFSSSSSFSSSSKAAFALSYY